MKLLETAVKMHVINGLRYLVLVVLLSVLLCVDQSLQNDYEWMKLPTCPKMLVSMAANITAENVEERLPFPWLGRRDAL